MPLGIFQLIGNVLQDASEVDVVALEDSGGEAGQRLEPRAEGNVRDFKVLLLRSSQVLYQTI